MEEVVVNVEQLNSPKASESAKQPISIQTKMDSTDPTPENSKKTDFTPDSLAVSSLSGSHKFQQRADSGLSDRGRAAAVLSLQASSPKSDVHFNDPSPSSESAGQGEPFPLIVASFDALDADQDIRSQSSLSLSSVASAEPTPSEVADNGETHVAEEDIVDGAVGVANES